MVLVPEVILIGGTPRSGKTTFARLLGARLPHNLVDLDHLRWALAPLLSLDEELESEKRIMSVRDTDQWHAEMDAREDAVWQVAGRYAGAVAYQGESGVISGIFRPAHALPLAATHRAVFFGDLNESTDAAWALAQGNGQNNWQRGWSESAVRRWASLNRERALRNADAAAASGFPFFDVSGGYAAAQARALAHFG